MHHRLIELKENEVTGQKKREMTGGDLFAGLSLAPSSSSGSPGTKAPHGDDDAGLGVVATSPPPPPPLVAASPGGSGSPSSKRHPASQQHTSSLPQGRVQAAPVTDKLLNLLGGGGNGSSGSGGGSGSITPAPSPGSAAGQRSVRVASPATSPLTPRTQKAADARTVLSAFSMESQDDPHSGHRENGGRATSISRSNGPPASDDVGGGSPRSPRRRVSDLPPPLGGDGPMAAAAEARERQRHTLRGAGVIKADTPILNGDVALRLIRKFADRTRPHVPESHGGGQPLSLWTRYVSGTPAEYDTRFDAYRQLTEAVAREDDGADDDLADNGEGDTAAASSASGSADAIVDAVLGESGDTMAKAREAVASFCHLLSVWSHASARMGEAERGGADFPIFCGMVATGYDTATSLVTHGCLDGVMIGIGPNRDEYHKVVEVLAGSVFSSDLSQSETELAAMKFLLSTGCRVNTQDGQAMLRGSHLLQTIRVLYQVYLSTATEANKTTARASLQQLVTSVFIRMIASPGAAPPSAGPSKDTEDVRNDGSDEGRDSLRPTTTAAEAEADFPSDNHRDAFLVLRSLCKLSMRNQPPVDRNSHPGSQSSGSSGSAMWDASKDHPTGGKSSAANGAAEKHHGHGDPHSKEAPQHLSTHGIHPALESKILALDLLLYVLNTTDMKGSFLQDCGPQFHYAIRNYLCVSLLKNCTSDDTRVVSLSLRVFVPIFQNFRSILKTEIEAFVTNVFFVILDSKNSPIEHKSLVVTLFDEICSDPTTLAEIFLNYDCDLSAVDLFHRIVNALSKAARTPDADGSSAISLVAGSGAARMERVRSENRELRLNAMRALRQVLASLHASIVEPMPKEPSTEDEKGAGGEDRSRPDRRSKQRKPSGTGGTGGDGGSPIPDGGGDAKQSLVQIYDSKKKRREEEAEIVLRFNQKPKAGIAYAAKCGHIDGSDPTEVARYLLKNKDRFEKTQIGDLLGREPEYEQGFSLKVLHEYVGSMDFEGLTFDDAIRYYLSGFRLPGEAQKIDRIMEKFAERYTEQNPEAFATADVAFILSFSIIMLNTDLHNPAIKEERRMTKEGFIRNNRGISDGQDLPQEMLTDIFDRIKENPISLKEDDDARERAGDTTSAASNALSPAVFFSSHYDEMEKTKESNFNKERDQIVRTTESLLKRRRHSTLDSGKSGNRRSRANSVSSKPQQVRYVRTDDSGLRDEYVAPMFEVTWGPALAAFSTAMESANGTVGALLAIATDEELEAAAVNAAETIEVCLTGFRFAIGTAGLVGNDTARDAYMLALSRFSHLGTGTLLEPRHIRCVQTMLALARSDGELLGSSWEHIFRALSEINRFHQLFQLMARNDRVVAAAAERRRSRLAERERKQSERERRKAAKDASDSIDDVSMGSVDASSETDASYGDASSLFDDSDDFSFNDEMDTKEIDEANARIVYQAVSEEMIEAIYERSSSMSTSSVKEFILQLCRVSRMEISNYGGHVGSDSNHVDLTKVQYRKHHELLAQTDKEGFHHHQTNIYNLQKLVEVTHYNMESRPRLVFAELWTTISAHLTSTALHSNPAVAMYAVDSFRQLSIQYLQREELGVFEFQRRFLKPLETVMARSEISITKEMLLKCVERIILMFGSPKEGSKGRMLRSGWRPVLAVLGLAGRDPDENIAKMGFELLTAQIQECLDQCVKSGDDSNCQGVLLVERFVDLVDALLIYVEGPHEEMSLQCIDILLKLCDFLADESTISPLVKKRRSVVSHENEETEDDASSSNQELELWWPILLGLSRSVGDPRKAVRRKSLESLFKILSAHFFPTGDKSANLDETSAAKKVQILQLVYRGILSPVLEFGDVDPLHTKTPELPNDFERFQTAPKPGEASRPPLSKPAPSWLDTTYDQFMDGCIQICLRSIEVFRQELLVEEIFAMLNSCLVSDSGAMSVKGLRRLEQFVSSDLRPSSITDDTWATVSHMLRRCLSVRGLPRRSSSVSLNGSSGSGASMLPSGDGTSKGDLSSVHVEEPISKLEEQESTREFIAEDSMFFDRRYIGSNTIAVIGKFLEGERFAKTLGLRWRLFLVSGLGKSIRDWECAASILAMNPAKTKVPRGHGPPSYLETAYYGRKWMNRFLLQIASMKEIEGTAAEGSKQAAAQSVVKEQTQALVSAFLEKEAIVAGEGKRMVLDVKLFDRLIILVQDMLAGYGKLPNEHLRLMPWLNPVLSSCIHTSNEEIRLAIQKLVKRLH